MAADTEARRELPLGLSARVIRRPARVFSSSRGAERFRRATDVIVLVLAAVAVVALAFAYPPSVFERSLESLLDTVPDWLDPVWSLCHDLLSAWAVLLLAAALVARRIGIALHALASLMLATLAAMAAGRVALGAWPELADVLALETEAAGFPVVRLAAGTALVLTLAPQLVRPLERTSRWIVLAGAVGAALTEPTSPSAAVAAAAIGVVAAAATRLAFGTSAGYPEASGVKESLAEIGVDVQTLELAGRGSTGAFLARAADEEGRPLDVKVFGRDAYDTQVLEKLWRTAWYQGDGPRLRLSRIEAVEHEALVTLLARQAGLVTSDVLTAAESSGGDALLVLRDSPRALSELAPGEVDDELLRGAWEALRRLAAAGIAHLRIDADALVVRVREVGVVGFERATLAPRADELATDRAQLLATTAALVGPDRALAVAIEELGVEGTASLLPYLQPAAFHSALRRSLDAAGLEADDLRAQAAEALGVDPPELVRLRRVSWWSLVQAALLVLAATTIIAALGDLDLEQIRSSLADASWAWIGVAFVVAQLPRVTQALSTLGSVPARLPFAPVYGMQLATGYMNLALPSNLARLAVNIRFFQRQGVPPAAAITAGAIDSFASTVVQAMLLVSLLAFSSATLSFGLETPSGDSVRLVLLLLGLGVAAVLVLVAVRRIREAILGRVRQWWPEVRAALTGLRASHKLGLLLGGSLATEVLFASALGLFAEALGYDVSLVDLLVINISVSLLASIVPIPGGIGVAEIGLTVGLVAAGMSEEAAFATVLLYRVATFYLPPVWGFFALRTLRRRSFL